MRLVSSRPIDASATSITGIMRPSSTAAISSYKVSPILIRSLMGVICKLIYC